jgi:hypothetical protein
MAKGRKPAKPRVEEKKIVEDFVTDSVTVFSEVVEQVQEDVLEEQEEVIVEDSVVELQEDSKNHFMMDISEFGVKADEAEKFVKTAIRFYFENKDKKMVEDSKLEKVKESLSTTNVDGKYEEVLQKVKKFEDTIKMNQFVPKKLIMEFTKSLK